jgi:ATP-dependent Lhr-like helicase
MPAEKRLREIERLRLTLDSLCASGQVVWGGVEPLGARDGRVALYLAEHEPLLARASTPVQGSVATSIRDVLARRGAVFFGPLAREVGGFPGDVLEVLWQLVWSGDVTNDTLEPIRAVHALRPSRRVAACASPRAPRTVLPGSEGRWSLRESRRTAPPRRTSAPPRRVARTPIDPEAAHARHRRLRRCPRCAQGAEDQGRVRRGYRGRSRGPQPALLGADERLALRDESPTCLQRPQRPTRPRGALIEWPVGAEGARPQRAAGALVVMRGGALIGWLGRGDHPLLTFLPDEEPARSETTRALASALADLVDGGGRRALLVSTVDGIPAADSGLASHFVVAGFVPAPATYLFDALREPTADRGARPSVSPGSDA